MDLISLDPMQRQLLDETFDAFTILANGGVVSLMHVKSGLTRWSSSAVDLFGLSGEYISDGASDWASHLHPEDRKRYMDVMEPLVEGRSNTYDITYRVRTQKGEYGNFRAVGAVLHDANGPILIGGVMFNEGLSDFTDPVTVLPNKSMYLKRLASTIAAGKATLSLMVGINDLSVINQTYGYTYGNRILQEISWLIQELVKDRCELFRADGSTFILLSSSLSREQVSAIYDMIRYQLQRGIEINGIRNNLVANGGIISVFDTSAKPSTVLAGLHYAYEESKNHSDGELVDFNGSIQFDRDSQLELFEALRDSIGENCKGFSLRYEPVYAAQTERLTGAEAVIHWEDERFGSVSHEVFMPLLERDFLFEELGSSMIRRGLEEGVRFLETYPDFLLCLNVNRIQVESDFFVDDLLDTLRETGFPTHQLSLKFARDCRQIEHGRICEIIEQLHAYEIMVIIDGFGSGSNSIWFLKDVPVDAVCLDSQFVDNVETSERDRSVLKHLTRMAAACVRHVNLKGIDRPTQLDIVRNFSVTSLQGKIFPELSLP